MQTRKLVDVVNDIHFSTNNSQRNNSANISIIKEALGHELEKQTVVYLDKLDDKPIAETIEKALNFGNRRSKNFRRVLIDVGYMYNTARGIKVCNQFFMESTELLLLNIVVSLTYTVVMPLSKVLHQKFNAQIYPAQNILQFTSTERAKYQLQLERLPYIIEWRYIR